MSGEEYRQAMDALARETKMTPESASRIERHLLDALESCDAGDAVSPPRFKHAIWRPWVAAAASLVLVASIAFAWRMNRPLVTVDHSTAPRMADQKSPPVGGIEPDATTPSPVKAVTQPTNRRKTLPKKTNVVASSGFVDLPWTAGLPSFESGEIVRMDIPVASLPTYGIDISSGGKGPIEADVLIGQDGLARAIRLVPTTSRSTQ